ncbi:triose-phosphate isomerase [Bisgaard Taxon 10/6]|uniref:Triose-phosphate isomerase n=1 Tax=Exercitatus varius TaxID=67857 RepID=A0AAW6Q6M1_9PAST|nr:triose-phosphate isomerase [Exercitatus varius]
MMEAVAHCAVASGTCGANVGSASADYADAKQAVIKQCLIELFGKEGNKIPVFYGGSVNPENAPELFVQLHIDGLFIGRSAWDAEKFYTLMSGLLTE